MTPQQKEQLAEEILKSTFGHAYGALHPIMHVAPMVKAMLEFEQELAPSRLSSQVEEAAKNAMVPNKKLILGVLHEYKYAPPGDPLSNVIHEEDFNTIADEILLVSKTEGVVDSSRYQRVFPEGGHLDKSQLLEFGFVIVSAMKANCYGVSMEEGRQLMNEGTIYEGVEPESIQHSFAITKETEILNKQAFFVAQQAIAYLNQQQLTNQNQKEDIK